MRKQPPRAPFYKMSDKRVRSAARILAYAVVGQRARIQKYEYQQSIGTPFHNMPDHYGFREGLTGTIMGATEVVWSMDRPQGTTSRDILAAEQTLLGWAIRSVAPHTSVDDWLYAQGLMCSAPHPEGKYRSFDEALTMERYRQDWLDEMRIMACDELARRCV